MLSCVRRSFSKFPREVDVVVVGGGISGTSLLYELGKRNIRSILLEQDLLSSGTTWHSAGMLWRLRPNDTEIRLLNKTRDSLREMEKKTGLSIFHENGGLFLASTEIRLNEYRRLRSIGKFFEIESEIVSKEECGQIHPYLKIDDLVGGLHSPGDGTIDPASGTQAFAKAARQLGCQIMEKAKVDKIEHENGQVTGVHVNGNFVKARIVINAAGSWARALCETAGVSIPLITFRHAYVVTEPIVKGTLPNVRDHDSAIYAKWQGESLAVGGYENNPILVDDIEKSPFSFSLYDLDWDVYSIHLENSCKRILNLENSGIAHTVCGPESFTPDHKPLVGPHPDLKGLWLHTGFNSAGLMLCAGVSEQSIEWLDTGAPDLDMFSYDITRFYGKVSNSWIIDRSRESYAKNYSIVFPHDQSLVARQERVLPLHEKLKKKGLVTSEVAAWERPYYFCEKEITREDFEKLLEKELTFSHSEQTFTYFKKEHEHTRDAVSLFDMSAFGKTLVTGKNAAAFLDFLSTQPIPQVNSSCYTMFLNEKGRAECDLTISRLSEEEFYLVSGSGDYDHVLRWLRQWRRDEVEIKDVTSDFVVLSLQGRHAEKIMSRLSENNFGIDDFPFSTLKQKLKTRKGVEFSALRLTFVGESGFELHTRGEFAEDLYDEIFEMGKEFDLKDAAYGAIESLSMEKGFRHYHSDLRQDDTPGEAGMSWITRKKLDSEVKFLGREATEREKTEGVKKRLVYVILSGDVPVFGLEILKRDSEVVGHLRRGCYSHSLNKTLGVGYIFRKEKKLTKKFIEGKYLLEVLGCDHECQVFTSTPFDPQNRRMKHIYDGQI